MKLFFALTFFFVISYPSVLFANWYEINAPEHVIAVGKIAEVGKISVFIISTPWCNPCRVLKDQLRSNNRIDMKIVDIYYVNMADNPTQMKQSESYYIWENIEQLDAWPYIYVTAPTTNIVSNFSPLKESDPYGRILKVINILENPTRNFDKSAILADRNTIKSLKIDTYYDENQSHYSFRNNRSSNSYINYCPENDTKKDHLIENYLIIQPQPVKMRCFYHDKTSDIGAKLPIFRMSFDIPPSHLSLEDGNNDFRFIIHVKYPYVFNNETFKNISQNLPRYCSFSAVYTEEYFDTTLVFTVTAPNKILIKGTLTEERGKSIVDLSFPK